MDAIDVNGVSYTIEYFMGGDWKFLAMVTGIDSATSTYPCIWCKCDKDQRHDISDKWSISRTTDENVELSKLPRSRKKYNVSSSPLFPKIPLKNIVIDNLHLFLRISDVLINLLIVELRCQDIQWWWPQIIYENICLESENAFIFTWKMLVSFSRIYTLHVNWRLLQP